MLLYMNPKDKCIIKTCPRSPVIKTQISEDFKNNLLECLHILMAD